MIPISISRIGTYKTCAYAAYLKYVRGIRKKERGVSPMTKGSIVHHILAEVFRGLYWYQQYHKPLDAGTIYELCEDVTEQWDAENRPQQTPTKMTVNGMEFVILDPDEEFFERWNRNLSDAKEIVIAFLQDFDYNRYEILTLGNQPAIEVNIDWVIPDTQFKLRGFVDAIMRDKHTGLVHVIDWKTRRSFNDYLSESLSPQTTAYQIALAKQYGIETDVFTIYQIKSSAPRIPSINKNNTTSRKDIATTWERYRDAVIANGEDPADYEEDMKPKLEGYEFTKPITIQRTESAKMGMWAEWLRLAKEWERALENEDFPHNYGWQCNRCPYNLICEAQLHDYDIRDLLDTQYEFGEDEDDVTDADDSVTTG